MAPTASTISGKAGMSSRNSKVSFIGGPCALPRSLDQHGGSLGGAERPMIVVKELGHGGRRHVEHRLGVDAEGDGQCRERSERDDLAIVEILDAGELGLVERPEDDLAIEPERIGG